MFVTNHALAGAAIGQRLPDRPVTAFLVGLGSHLAMDAVPHWGCDVYAPGGAERFYGVARRDGILGLTVIAAALAAAGRGTRTATAAAIAGAVVLDLDKPLEHFVHRNPFPRMVQRIHGAIQRESARGLLVEVAAGTALAFLDATFVVQGRRRPGGPTGRHELSINCSSAGPPPATPPS